MSALTTLPPFFSPYYFYNRTPLLARGEDTLMGMAASQSHIRCLDIQTPIFHDTYGDYPKVPDLRNDSRVRDRLYYACTGWIGRNVFFRWKTGHTPSEFTQRNRQLAAGAKALARYTNDRRFLYLPDIQSAAGTWLAGMIGAKTSVCGGIVAAGYDRTVSEVEGGMERTDRKVVWTMKVLLINHFPLEGSGSGTYTKNIALHLRKRGHEVCVIFPENRPVLMLPGIRMFPVMFSTGKASWSSLPFNFPCFTTHPQSRTTFADLSSGELAQYLTLFSSVLRQAVREFQPDVIHAQHAWCLSWLASLCDIPLVVTIHGTDLMGCRKWPVFRGFAEEAIAGSAKVLAISQDNRDLALSVLPSCANKLLLLPNGYNEDIFYPEEVDRESLFDSLGLPYRGEYIVLFAGKLAEFKGVDTLLRVAHRYERLTEREIVTLIAGDGEEREKLSDLHKLLGLRHTFFLGNQKQDELRRLYNAADVFVMPPRREPFGLVALEAMACGLPVVGSNEGGLPEFINSSVGTLVSSNDEDAFCGAILEELAHSREAPERRAFIARYARENFAQELFVTKLEDVYASVLS